MSELSLFFRIILAAVFAISGLSKLADWSGTRNAITNFGLPAWAASPLAIVLPAIELVIAVTLIPSTTAIWATAGSIALLAAFTTVIGLNLAKGRTPDCNCFGQLHT